MSARRFCLMVTGRCASTSLMNAFGGIPGVLLPSMLFDCPNSELLHPHQVGDHARWFANHLGRSIVSATDLIDTFYELNSDARYVGFKSMPNRHGDFESFARRQDIQFITLRRKDIASTVASFLAAAKFQCWDRRGGPQPERWTFNEVDIPAVRRNLVYITTANRMIESIPHAIHLYYEELCDPAFHNKALDHFFEQEVTLFDQQPATCGRQYVTNWDEFVAFVEQEHEVLAQEYLG